MLYCFYDKRLTGYSASVFHKDGKIAVVNGARQSDAPGEYFKNFVEYLKEDHGLVIESTDAKEECTLLGMSPTAISAWVKEMCFWQAKQAVSTAVAKESSQRW
jgi:hypothetical protein